MRIFLSVQQAQRRHAVPSYGFWETYFKNGLTEAGHEWLEAPGVDWAEGLTQLANAERSEYLDRTWSRTLEFLREEHARKPIDFFLGYLFPEQVSEEGVRLIRALGIPCVNFFCDNIRELRKIPQAYRPFDLHWVPEFEALDMYAREGLPHLFAPMPLWVPPEFRTLPEAEQAVVTFIGSHDPLRAELLGESIEAGLDVSIYGAGWIEQTAQPARSQSVFRKALNQVEFVRRFGLRGYGHKRSYGGASGGRAALAASGASPPLAAEAYFPTLREAVVTIGVNRYPSFFHSFQQPGKYSRLRDLEAPMIGACYLTEMCPGLERLFEPGIEIETYTTADELVQKAKRLKEDRSLRQQLRKRGQTRALAEHTIGRTVDAIRQRL